MKLTQCRSFWQCDVASYFSHPPSKFQFFSSTSSPEPLIPCIPSKRLQNPADMNKKSSRKLVYTLSSPSSHNGHSLGVNSLVIDPNAPDEDSLLYQQILQHSSTVKQTSDNSDQIFVPPSGVLYSAGRDGAINAWGIHDMDLLPPDFSTADQTDNSQTTIDNSTFSPQNPARADVNYNLRQNGQPKRSLRNFSVTTDHSTSSVSKILGHSLAAFLHPADAPQVRPMISKPVLKDGFTSFGLSGQNHTNWVNDIVLVNNRKQGKCCLTYDVCTVY